jgi:hypothetical protein
MSADQPIRDYFEELAAFLEFDGLLPRNDAVRHALAETAREFDITVDLAARVVFLNDAALAAVRRASDVDGR